MQTQIQVVNNDTYFTCVWEGQIREFRNCVWHFVLCLNKCIYRLHLGLSPLLLH